MYLYISIFGKIQGAKKVRRRYNIVNNCRNYDHSVSELYGLKELFSILVSTKNNFYNNTFTVVKLAVHFPSGQTGSPVIIDFTNKCMAY